MSDSPRPARSTEPASAAPVERDDRFPRGIPYIVGNEAAERFSFYGLRQILYVYLVGLFSGFTATTENAPAEAKVHATQVAHLFNAGVYLFPLIGAILADRLLGKYRVIFWVSLLYVAGHLSLAVGGHAGTLGDLSLGKTAFLLGLLLISLGAGGIKPCVSANVGDQFTTKNAHLVPLIFQIFYFSVNFGSSFASVLTPYLYQHYGPEIAFGVPGVLMAAAAVVFWAGRNKFVRIPPKPGGKLGAMDFVASTLMTVPLLVAIYVLVEDAESVVEAVAKTGWGALPGAVGAIVHHYWWIMLCALVSFVLGVAFAQYRQRKAEDTGFLAILLYCLRHRSRRQPGEDFWAPARAHFGAEAAEGPPAVLRIIVVFSMVSVFWALFDQYSSTWVQQATAMNRTFHVPQYLWFWWFLPVAACSGVFAAFWLFLWVSNRALPRAVKFAFFGGIIAWLGVTLFLQFTRGGIARIDLLAAQIGALNPFLVMTIIPLLNFGVYRPLERRGKPLKPLLRMTIGMFIASLSYVVVALLQSRVESLGVGQVHVFWQILPYVLITTAEVLVSVTGLEFAYTQAPRAMKSTIMSFWLLCVTFGNVLVAFLAPLQSLSLTTFFWTFAGLMAAAACIFVVLASRYRGKTYLQG